MNIATPLLLLVLTYAIAVAVMGWHIVGKRRRTSIVYRICSGATCVAGRAGAGIKSLMHAPRLLWREVIALSACAFESGWRRRRSLGVGMTLFAAPVSLLVAFGNFPRFQAYDDTAAHRDPVVASLLDGERLVPPAALPPELFATPETRNHRIELPSASREWMMLDPEFQQRLLKVFRAMETHGYRMVLLEGYRSPERQQMLAELGPHITNAKAFQSYHQFGLAADSAFYRNGRLVITEKDPWALEGYRLYGVYAESFGLTWGGRWQMRDLGHVELRRNRVLK